MARNKHLYRRTPRWRQIQMLPRNYGTACNKLSMNSWAVLLKQNNHSSMTFKTNILVLNENSLFVTGWKKTFDWLFLFSLFFVTKQENLVLVLFENNIQCIVIWSLWSLQRNKGKCGAILVVHKTLIIHIYIYILFVYFRLWTWQFILPKDQRLQHVL